MTMLGGLDRPTSQQMPISTIEDAIQDFANGNFVIIVDDEDRENEGDLCVAAQLVTPDRIAFMAKHAAGLICLAINGQRLDELQIEPMVKVNTSRYGTAFSVSVEAKDLVTTGISAHDRCATILHILNPEAKPGDFSKPGHTFPLRAAEGGVMVRAGQTEAAVDLAKLAGLYPAGVICEVMNDDGTMARLADLQEFARAYGGIRVITIRDLITYRRHHDKLVNRRVSARVPLDGKTWQVHAYEDLANREVHLALVLGSIDSAKPVLVRAHSRCLTGDVFGSQRCDCGPQLQASLKMISDTGTGVVLYISNHEGRGIGLINKLLAYNLQDNGLDTVEANEELDQPADSRDYGIGNQILYDVGVRKMRLLTNNPRKLIGLAGYGLEVVEQVPIKIQPSRHNRRYLNTKRDKLGHLL
jgi:3,4-dihydroxy 2-butanone 4-phosphate synthase / GTP cyclohydrolase II